MGRPHVLLIDDDAPSMSILQPALVDEGFDVEHISPGLDAIRRMLIGEPDLVLLGVDCQCGDWQFCRRLLTFVDSPLLLLLSTKDKLDRVKALELGADDCMVKPVLSIEVVARSRALLRRRALQKARSQQSYFVDGDLVVDLTRREVWRDGNPVALTPTEFRFLASFTEHVGEVLSHERLTIQVWGPNYPGTGDTIKHYVYRLRQKIEQNPHRPQRLLSRRGQGYIFRSLSKA